MNRFDGGIGDELVYEWMFAYYFSVLAGNVVLVLSTVLIQTVVSCILHHERTENRAP